MRGSTRTSAVPTRTGRCSQLATRDLSGRRERRWRRTNVGRVTSSSGGGHLPVPGSPSSFLDCDYDSDSQRTANRDDRARSYVGLSPRTDTSHDIAAHSTHIRFGGQVMASYDERHARGTSGPGPYVTDPCQFCLRVLCASGSLARGAVCSRDASLRLRNLQFH